MKSVATTQSPVRPASLPNVLTYLRILAVPAIVLCLLLIKGDAGRWWALAVYICLLYTSPSPRDRQKSRMPSSV